MLVRRCLRVCLNAFCDCTACMYVMYLCAVTYICMNAMYVCMHVCMYVMFVLYVMYVMYVCNVCTYVCMYVM